MLLSNLDRSIVAADRLLRVFAGIGPQARRPSPAANIPEAESLTPRERRHAAGLMRVNHSGEVCAQALYEGQAMVAREPSVRRLLRRSAREEQDHLAWCAERLQQLGAHPSRLNPAFYLMSLGTGLAAGVAGDRISLGFIHATEDQVEAHLKRHARSLPSEDLRSRAVVAQMQEEEAEHGAHALEAGGVSFPRPVRRLMTAVSRLLTATTYRI